MTSDTDRLTELRDRLRGFVRERDWEQFHSPKNLAMAMIVEAAELVEHFQWSTEQESRELTDEQRIKVEQEIADTFVYLLRLSDVLGIDLIDAAHRKMDLNAKKYPADKARGRNDKYTAYE
ncbi:nucleotide pyrophosphohydrolase [Novimethylophilus kurashikiensis]|uniref:Nucleotide pyrophosphohydrolase n=1 Tax=Novimethylophilus kurashikiensis TaxID=1825523 RepID=A0A2R5FAD6_9PROT|nr:nucleotide pyrophosphohydrolase [Novimethylophilus kurashikiensis]GBG15192.1 nucleotide pyrophosphohydrolase [Novimethylophilus kurashikiensis]